MLDHMEPKSEESTEPAPAKETNLELSQGKPWYIPPPSLTFALKIYFMLSWIVY
jgi:hypothetical protein